MATTLGKRKRKAVTKQTNTKDELAFDQDAQEIFRRHFEAQFKPLPEVKKPATVRDIEENDSDEESEWNGISDGEDGIQIIEHTDAEARVAAMSKEQLKSFMTSKPPTSTIAVTVIRDKGSVEIADDDPSEAANLKKDLALQRLLAESHLLDSATNPVLSGNNRHKATDLRLQALGSKTSILKQEKMPMAMRRGIVAKQNEREDNRRKEARENGIILEKATKTKAAAGTSGFSRKRDRGVGAPGVGRFSGGTLTLSKKDIFEIEGPKKSATGRGGRGGGRGRGRGRG